MPLHVHDDYPIHTGNVIQDVKTHLYGKQKTNDPPLVQEYLEQKGDPINQDLWYKGMYSIKNMCFMNDDTSY